MEKTMTKQEIESTLIEIIREELEVETLAVSAEADLDSIPGWDSVSMSCIMISVERRFSFEFSGEDLTSLSSLAALVDLVIARKRL